MGAVDMVLSLKESRIQKRLLETSREQEAKRMQQVEFSSNSENEASASSNTGDNSNLPQNPSQPKCFHPTDLGLAAALDRTKVSDRNAVYIIAAAAESLGHSSSAQALSKETVRR